MGNLTRRSFLKGSALGLTALGGQMEFRALMKRARLPRLARALAR